MKIRNLMLALVCLAAMGSLPAQETEDHGEEEGHSGEEESRLVLDAQERDSAGVVTAIVEPRVLRETLRVPGEITINAYRSSKVTPRIAAQIVSRNAVLGDVVEEGQPLVTLSSVEVAEAQGALLVAEQEWQRVQSLGREVVSDARYVEAEVAHQKSHARLLAYGMGEAEIEKLKKNADPTRATGRFDLIAPQSGRVIYDAFIIGDFVEPGRVLFELSDESVLWVEASIRPESAVHIESGAPVTILHGNARLPGKVLQVHHRLNEATRRQSVRIAVDNAEDLLHPGAFVDVDVPVGSDERMLAIPMDAAVLIDGTQAVFRLHDGAFEPVPIDTGEARGAWLPIKSGLQPGDVIAIEGAFHLKSLLLKSQLGSGHGH